jgi:hypothetical protein
MDTLTYSKPPFSSLEPKWVLNPIPKSAGWRTKVPILGPDGILPTLLGLLEMSSWEDALGKFPHGLSDQCLGHVMSALAICLDIFLHIFGLMACKPTVRVCLHTTPKHPLCWWRMLSRTLFYIRIGVGRDLM